MQHLPEIEEKVIITIMAMKYEKGVVRVWSH